MAGVRGAAVGMTVLLLAGPALVGCDSSDSGTSASEPTSAPATTDTAGASEAIAVGERYLTALAGGPDTEAMLALSALGSVAERYAVHTRALSEIQVASGQQPDDLAVVVHGDEATVTFSNSSGDVPTAWADFTLDEQGRLDSFTIDGKPLEDRLIVDGASDTAARVASAFELVSNDSPVVIVEFKNQASRRYQMARAVYVAPDGTRSTSRPTGAGILIPAGTSNKAAIIFGTAPLGGTMTLVGDLAGTPVRHHLALTP